MDKQIGFLNGAAAAWYLVDGQNLYVGPEGCAYVDTAHDFEALYKQTLAMCRERQDAISQLVTELALVRSELAEAKKFRDEAIELSTQFQAERNEKQAIIDTLSERLYRAEQRLIDEPQAAYIAELRDASPILAAIAVHQSQGVR